MLRPTQQQLHKCSTYGTHREKCGAPHNKARDSIGYDHLGMLHDSEQRQIGATQQVEHCQDANSIP